MRPRWHLPCKAPTSSKTAAAGSKRYYPWLDGLRALAALFVVVHHASPLFGVEASRGYLAVDLFFLLSGLVIANAYEPALRGGMPFSRFVVIRLARLYPLYLVAFVTAVAALAITPFVPFTYPSIPVAILLGSLMLPALGPWGAGPAYPFNSPSWSLFIELVANFVYARFPRLFGDGIVVAIMLLSAAAITILVALLPDHKVDFGWSATALPFGFFRIGFSFFAGILMYRFAHNLPAPAALSARPALTVALSGGLVVLSLGVEPAAWLSPYWDLGSVLLVFPVVIWLGMQVEAHGRARAALAFLGVASYALYILHVPAFELLRALVVRLGLLGLATDPATGLIDRIAVHDALDGVAPWGGLLFVAVLLVLAHLLDRFMEQPIRRLFHRRQPHRPETIEIPPQQN